MAIAMAILRCSVLPVTIMLGAGPVRSNRICIVKRGCVRVVWSREKKSETRICPREPGLMRKHILFQRGCRFSLPRPIYQGCGVKKVAVRSGFRGSSSGGGEQATSQPRSPAPCPLSCSVFWVPGFWFSGDKPYTRNPKPWAAICRAKLCYVGCREETLAPLSASVSCTLRFVFRVQVFGFRRVSGFGVFVFRVHPSRVNGKKP